VDVDVDVDHLARLEAQRLGGGADDIELSRLGVRNGQDLRSETSKLSMQVCDPNGYSALMPQPIPPNAGGHDTHARPLDPFSRGRSR
jgi:hypothetical protein